MIDELSAALRDGALVLSCAVTVGELRTFVRKSNGRMAGSPHDDRVISLGIANQMLKFVWLPEYAAAAPVPRNSLIWWEQFLVADETPTSMPLGGFNVRNILANQR
jgi:hypothetical protein